MLAIAAYSKFVIFAPGSIKAAAQKIKGPIKDPNHFTFLAVFESSIKRSCGSIASSIVDSYCILIDPSHSCS